MLAPKLTKSMVYLTMNVSFKYWPRVDFKKQMYTSLIKSKIMCKQEKKVYNMKLI